MAAARLIKQSLTLPVLAIGLVALCFSAPANASPQLKVGVGRADITPPTGYYMMGWVRSDAKIIGQNTRLWARVIVLKRGHHKVALVSEDLNGIPGGMMETAAERVPGFSERNVLDSASHTHAAPTGFYNYPTFNTVFMTIDSPTDFQLTGGLDPQLYAFEVRQLAKAIRRANRDLGPGKVGWGEVDIKHLTTKLHGEQVSGEVPEGMQGLGEPNDYNDHQFEVTDPAVNQLRIDLNWSTPDDIDLYVYRKEGSKLTSVGQSTGSFGDKENVVVDQATAGTYVARVVNYTAVPGNSYTLSFDQYEVGPDQITPGHTEAWTMTCETPKGKVLERRQVTVLRGEVATENFACGNT